VIWIIAFAVLVVWSVLAAIVALRAGKHLSTPDDDENERD
jgi:hypothetical protein